MEVGLRLLERLPLSSRVLRTIHETLLQDVRGRERRPGEFRATPVWIGSPTDTPENATYVPPLSEEMHEALRDWEHFANEAPRIPMLVRCALLHYQCETIHPFLDGNGRLGRLLIVFFPIRQLERRGLLGRLGRFGRGGRNLGVAQEVFGMLNTPRPEELPQRFTRLERKK